VSIIYLALVIFGFMIYANPASNVGLGSISRVYDNLTKMAQVRPIANNKGGSLMTMMSLDGLIFGIINIIGNCERAGHGGGRGAGRVERGVGSLQGSRSDPFPPRKGKPYPQPASPSPSPAVGTVFVDQSYWQGAIAAKPSATYKGYVLGGMCWWAGRGRQRRRRTAPGHVAERGCLHRALAADRAPCSAVPRPPDSAWAPASTFPPPCPPFTPTPTQRFAVPFSMATFMGLGARAMNLPITIAESNAGLVPPAVATMLLGSGGAFLLVFQLWMAVTSTGSAEQIAVSSLISYDVYR
jgi:hypothetical protein